jgi:hypothetical protein
MPKTNAHTQYIDFNGNRVAGVSTILSVLDKPALVVWANRLGLQGIDSTKYKDKMADIGTITHLRILHQLKCTQPDLSEYSQADIKASDNCMASYQSWLKGHKLEPICIETPLTSDRYGYGGTPDFIGLVDGRLEIIDYKTGNGIYGTAFYQIAAYRQMAQELGHKVEHARILRIGRSSDEGFEERTITKFDDEFEMFLCCLKIYNLLKKMGRRL